MTRSKFTDALKAAREHPCGTEEETAAAAIARAPGRPNGKRTDPAFVQTTCYLRKTTLGAVQIATLQESIRTGEKRQEFSEIVEDLLTEWLAARPQKGE